MHCCAGSHTRSLRRVLTALLRVGVSQRKPAEGEKKEGGEAEEAEPDTGHEKTHFHGASERDYAGNSWLAAPKDKKRESDTCFLPKRWIHTWCVRLPRIACAEQRVCAVDAAQLTRSRAPAGRGTPRAWLPFASFLAAGTCCCLLAWTAR